jgi:hypothetical protein
MNWQYENQDITTVPDGFIAFVYLITNLQTNRLYVGKKTFFSTVRKPPLKGMKRKRIIKTESDWRTYTGSSQALNDDVELGHKIQKQILHLCTTKGAASYLELQEQVERRVLFDEKYYNRFVGAKIHAAHVKGLNYGTDTTIQTQGLCGAETGRVQR